MTPQPHPQRCETCNFARLQSPPCDTLLPCFCGVTDSPVIHFAFHQIEKTGCASHSSRPAPSSDPLATVFNFDEFDGNAMEWLKQHDATIRNAATYAENKRVLDAIEKFKTEAWARNDPCDGGFTKFYQSLRHTEAQQ